MEGISGCELIVGVVGSEEVVDDGAGLDDNIASSRFKLGGECGGSTVDVGTVG